MKHLHEIVTRIHDGEEFDREQMLELAGSEEALEDLAALLRARKAEIADELAALISRQDQFEAHVRDGTEPPEDLIDEIREAD